MKTNRTYQEILTDLEITLNNRQQGRYALKQEIKAIKILSLINEIKDNFGIELSRKFVLSLSDRRDNQKDMLNLKRILRSNIEAEEDFLRTSNYYNYARKTKNCLCFLQNKADFLRHQEDMKARTEDLFKSNVEKAFNFIFN